jgi:hypothetical protein
MRRREFIAGLGSTATWPLVARAQQGLPVIGLLESRPAADMSTPWRWTCGVAIMFNPDFPPRRVICPVVSG